MSQNSIRNIPVEALVSNFVDISIRQDRALLMDEKAYFRLLYQQKVEILDELKVRSGDQRRALLQLYDHPNMQVRLNAATATLAVAPQAARQALEVIRALQWQPQALEAGMALFSLEKGIYKPM